MTVRPAYLDRFVRRDETGWYVIRPYAWFGSGYRATHQQRSEFERSLRRYLRLMGLSGIGMVIITRLLIHRVLQWGFGYELVLAALVDLLLLLAYRASVRRILAGAEAVSTRFRPTSRRDDAVWDWMADVLSRIGLVLLTIVSFGWFALCLFTIAVNIFINKRMPEAEVVVIGSIFGIAALFFTRGFYRQRKIRA